MIGWDTEFYLLQINSLADKSSSSPFHWKLLEPPVTIRPPDSYAKSTNPPLLMSPTSLKQLNSNARFTSNCHHSSFCLKKRAGANGLRRKSSWRVCRQAGQIFFPGTEITRHQDSHANPGSYVLLSTSNFTLFLSTTTEWLHALGPSDECREIERLNRFAVGTSCVFWTSVPLPAQEKSLSIQTLSHT